MHVIQQFPNLVFTEEAFAASFSGSLLDPGEKRRMLEAFSYLDLFGPDKTFMGRRIRGKQGAWELVVKGSSRKEWTFAITVDADDHSKMIVIDFNAKEI
ncbi:hypothetical protein [Paenibacillus sp. MBLB4367]|uniref:hypothetical protein n=1 Tax=Paenibacillus sp. MBLB4367 TaxID=3384767 RepID=UPI0039081FDF